MNDDIFHRIEHKLDIILEKMNLSSMAETSSNSDEKNQLMKMVHMPPALPQDPRMCPVCTAAIKITPTITYSKDGQQIQGNYRVCGCKITALNGIFP